MVQYACLPLEKRLPLSAPSSSVFKVCASQSTRAQSSARPRRVVAKPSVRAINKFGEGVNRRIIVLRLEKRMGFAEIARTVGCGEWYARHIVLQAIEAISSISHGNPS